MCRRISGNRSLVRPAPSWCTFQVAIPIASFMRVGCAGHRTFMCVRPAGLLAIRSSPKTHQKFTGTGAISRLAADPTTSIRTRRSGWRARIWPRATQWGRRESGRPRAMRGWKEMSRLVLGFMTSPCGSFYRSEQKRPTSSSWRPPRPHTSVGCAFVIFFGFRSVLTVVISFTDIYLDSSGMSTLRMEPQVSQLLD